MCISNEILIVLCHNHLFLKGSLQNFKSITFKVVQGFHGHFWRLFDKKHATIQQHGEPTKSSYYQS